MRLFYITPLFPSKLCVWFILETICILFNFVLFTVFIVFATRVRAHINLKIFGIFLIPQYLPFGLGRLVIIGFESGVLKQEISLDCSRTENRPCSLDPGQNDLIVMASWWRCYFFIIGLTLIFWFSLERQLAMYYIRDYERVRRLWIPLILCLSIVTVSAVAATLFTFELFIPIPVLEAIGGVILGSGMILFLQSYYKTRAIFHELSQTGKSSKHTYTLSLRFQLQENLWCFNLMRNGFVGLAIVGFLLFACYLASTLDIAKEVLGLETTQLFDALFNCLVAYCGFLILLSTIVFNDYMLNLFKSFAFGSRSKVQEQDATQVYFVKLRQQWDEPLDKLYSREGTKNRWIRSI